MVNRNLRNHGKCPDSLACFVILSFLHPCYNNRADSEGKTALKHDSKTTLTSPVTRFFCVMTHCTEKKNVHLIHSRSLLTAKFYEFK